MAAVNAETSTLALAAALVFLAIPSACLDAPTIVCSDGRICHSGTVCDDTHGRCVLPDQLQTCDGLDDDDPCTVGISTPGRCSAGVCLVEGCGDGFAHDTEECDGNDLRGMAGCTDLVGHWSPGPISCRGNCTIDDSQCDDFCGDGIVTDSTEDCDGSIMNGMTSCADFGYYNSAEVTCSNICQYDLSSCEGFCSDLDVNGPELCDGDPPVSGTCRDFGFDVGALECSSLCTAGFERCGHFGWNETAMGGAGVFGLWGASEDFIIAVGSHFTSGAGFIQYFDGLGWTSMAIPAGIGPVRGVWGSSATDVFAVGSSGTILHYDGGSWTAMNSGTANHLNAVWGVAGNAVYAVGDSGTVLFFDGTSWETLVWPNGSETLGAIWGTSADNVLITGAALYRFDGADWAQEPLPAGLTSVKRIWGSRPSDLYMLGDGAIVRYDGSAWEQLPGPITPFFPELVDAHGSTTGHLFMVWRDQFTSFVSHFDGGSWTDFPLYRDLGSVWSASSGRVLVTGEGASFEYRGASWTAPRERQLEGLWGLGSSDLYGVAADLYSDHGSGFGLELAQPEGYDFFTSVSGSSSNDVWTFAPTVAGGRLYHFDGASWAENEIAFRADWLMSLGPKTVYALSSSGTSFRRFNGTSWDVQAAPGEDYFAARAVGPDNVVAVGINGQIAHFDGSVWTNRESGTPYNLLSVWSSGPDDIFAVGEHGSIVHFDGNAWSSMDSSTSDALNVVVGTAPDDVFAFGALGTALYFDGDSWSPLRTTSTRNFVAALALPTKVIAFTHADAIPAEEFRLARSRRWTCRSRESSCADRVDDDCDGVFDSNDSDCATALRMVQVHSGNVDYFELENRGVELANLHNMSFHHRAACDAKIRSYSFPPDAIVLPGERFRVIDDDVSMQIRERVAPYAMCQEPTDGGWVALCAGDCDLVDCSNVIDYLEYGTPPSPPACATFAGGPIDVSLSTNTDSVVRSAFTGLGASGVAADWTVGPASRD